MSAGSTPTWARAFAPATVGNVAVGFDILGFELPVVGDRVTVTRFESSEPQVLIDRVEGDETIPTDPGRNTAGVALTALLEAQPRPLGLRLRIDKGIPLAAGMGGSAASAVAAVVAANAVLDEPLSRAQQCEFSIAGEASASGAAHADNVAPCLHGGLTLVLSHQPPRILPLPLPDVVCAFVHPHLHIETKSAREVLSPHLELSTHARQSGFLAGFVAACYRGDLDLLATTLRDVVVEPQRAQLIPGFSAVQQAALGAGALGASISGAGPSVFAWCREEAGANAALDGMQRAFRDAGLESDGWVSRPGMCGARVLETGD